MPTLPLISIVVAVYNGKATLQQCLDSIRAQTYLNVELIVIDGGSTDGTTDILQKNAHLIDYWVSEPDRGIYNAWNKALTKATGDWVCFLGADDYFWSTDVLERMALALIQLPAETQLAYAQIMLLGLDDAPLYPLGNACMGRMSSSPEVMGLPPHPGLMHRRSLFQRLGGFDERFRIAGDTEMLVRALKQSHAQFIPDLVMVGMRQGGISSQQSSTLKSLHELRRIQLQHGVRWPGLALSFAWCRAGLRWLLWRLLGDRLARKVVDGGRALMGKPAYWTHT